MLTRVTVSVRARTVMLTIMPLLGLGIVFALYWLSAAEISRELQGSQAETQTARAIGLFRDDIVALQLELADFRTEPSAAKRDAAARALAAGRESLASLRETATSRVRESLVPLSEGLGAVAQDTESVLAGQEAIGYGETGGLTAKLNATLDDLETSVIADLDYSDPLGAAVGDAYRTLRIGQYRFAGSASDADRDAFTKAADAMRRASMGPS